jgi:hypothetical protein
VATCGGIRFWDEELTVISSDKNLLTVTSNWVSLSKTTFDFWKTIRKVAGFFGNAFLDQQAMRVVNGTSILRVYGVVLFLVKTVRERRRLRLQSVSEFIHAVSDCVSTVAFAIAFFQRQARTVLNFAAGVGLFNDATDVVTYAMQYRDCCDRGKKLKERVSGIGGSDSYWDPVIEGNRNLKINTMIKLVKSIASLACTVFVLFVLITGTALAVPLAQVLIGVGVVAALLSIMPYYHQHWVCRTYLNVKEIKL